MLLLSTTVLLCILLSAVAQQMENARNCVDLSHDCPKRRSLCHNDLFEDLMREQCRKFVIEFGFLISHTFVVLQFFFRLLALVVLFFFLLVYFLTHKFFRQNIFIGFI